VQQKSLGILTFQGFFAFTAQIYHIPEVIAAGVIKQQLSVVPLCIYRQQTAGEYYLFYASDKLAWRKVVAAEYPYLQAYYLIRHCCFLSHISALRIVVSSYYKVFAKIYFVFQIHTFAVFIPLMYNV